MTHMTNTGDVDLDITVNGAFIHAPAGATVEVPDDVASRLPEVFDVPRGTRPTKPRARKAGAQAGARKAGATASQPEPAAPTGATTEES